MNQRGSSSEIIANSAEVVVSHRFLITTNPGRQSKNKKLTKAKLRVRSTSAAPPWKRNPRALTRACPSALPARPFVEQAALGTIQGPGTPREISEGKADLRLVHAAAAGPPWRWVRCPKPRTGAGATTGLGEAGGNESLRLPSSDRGRYF